jgi:hypothetical protein
VITCQQAVKINVNAGGLDFNKLVWEFPNGFTIQNSGSSGGNSNSYHGAIAIVDAIVPSGANDGWANNALMTYTGPLTNCQVKLTLISFSGGNATAQAKVSVFQDGNQLVSQSVQVFPATFNFTVQAGNMSQIQIGIEPPPNNPLGVAVACDIFNFPGPNFEGIVKFEFLPHS